MNKTTQGTGNVFKDEFMNQSKGAHSMNDASSLVGNQMTATDTISRGRMTDAYKNMDRILANDKISRGKLVYIIHSIGNTYL